MKTLIFLFGRLSVIFLVSCSVSNYDKIQEHIYRVNALDNTSIVGYNLISIVDDKNSKFILLAKRFGAGVDKPPFDPYDTIKIGAKYRLHITESKIDNLYFTEKYSMTKDIYFEFDSIIVLHNDSVLTPVYSSDDVFDKFVKK